MLGANPANAATSLLYTGEMYDSSASMYYLRARWYDQQTGRFNRMDPFAGNNEDPQSLHKYLYCHANPVNGIDPSGEFSWASVASVVIWSAVALFAMWVSWSRIHHHSFSRWGQPYFYPAWLNGQQAIRSYQRDHLQKIIQAETYKHEEEVPDLNAIFDTYVTLYPQVTSRTCQYALDDLMAKLRPFVQADPDMRKGITFMSAYIQTTDNDPSTYDEPTNILILMPTKYERESNMLGTPGWYDNDAKKNIIFFYPGSSPPLRPVGNLYEAVAESSWGTFDRLHLYKEPSF